jgi:hypothetical protein
MQFDSAVGPVRMRAQDRQLPLQPVGQELKAAERAEAAVSAGLEGPLSLRRAFNPTRMSAYALIYAGNLPMHCR